MAKAKVSFLRVLFLFLLWLDAQHFSLYCASIATVIHAPVSVHSMRLHPYGFLEDDEGNMLRDTARQNVVRIISCLDIVSFRNVGLDIGGLLD